MIPGNAAEVVLAGAAREMRISLVPDMDSRGVRCTVETNGATTWSGTFQPELPPALGPDALRSLEGYVESPPDRETLRRLGDALFQLLPGPARLSLRSLVEAPARPVARSRVWLDLQDPSLAALPWEFLTLEGEAGEPVALRPGINLLRGRPTQAAPAPALGERLRVLVAWADPASPGFPPLAGLRPEVESLARAFGAAECARAEVRSLPHVTPEVLQQALHDFRPHAVHFIGHGAAGPDRDGLVLEGAAAGAHRIVSVLQLNGWLRAAGVHLLFLSACGTSNFAADTSIAETGPPAIVATQLPLRDAAPGLLSRAFYAALCEGRAVDEALQQARQAVRGMGVDWGAPVLCLRCPPFALNAGPAARAPAPTTNHPFHPNPYFQGRTRELAWIDAALSVPGASPAALAGMGGVGKTQLASEYAHRHGAQYPGGVFWLNARDTFRLQEGYAQLAPLLHLPEDLELPRLAAAVRERLGRLDMPVLLILDDLTEATELQLPGGPVRVLITTRERYLARGTCRTLDLEPLDDGPAAALLQSHRSAEDGHDGSVTEIGRLLGNLPLALALAAHQVERLGLSFPEYRQRLAENRVEVLEQARRRFVTGTGHSGSVFDAIDIACRSLGSTARDVLSAAACLAPRGIRAETVAEIVQLSDTLVRECLADLLDISLLTRQADGALAQHELVRVYALGRTSDTRRAKLLHQAADAVSRRLSAANTAMAWREAEQWLPHAQAVLDWREPGAGEDLARCRLRRGIALYRFHQGELREARRLIEEGLEHSTAQGIDAVRERAALLKHLAETEVELGATDRALAAATEALALVNVGLPESALEVGEFHVTLGYVYRHRREFERAAAEYRRGLELATRAAKEATAFSATCISNLGALAELQGRPAEALPAYEQALAIDRAVFGAWHPKAAIRLNNTGRVLSRLERYPEAAERHREALAINLDHYPPLHLDVAMSHWLLAQSLAAAGADGAADDEYRRALPGLARFYGDEDARCTSIRARLGLQREEP